MVESSQPARKKRSMKSSASGSRPEAMMQNSNFFIVHLLPVRTAIDVAPQVLRVIAGISRRRPDEDFAAVPVVASAVEFSPRVTLHLEPPPPPLFGIGNRSFDLLQRMPGTVSHPSLRLSSVLLTDVNTLGPGISLFVNDSFG